MIRPFRILLICLLIAGGLTCSKNGAGDSSSALPAASINDISQDRELQSSVFAFRVSLNKKTSKDVSIQYQTLAGTAKENTDFKPSTGTLTIPANQLNGVINIEVTGDSLRKANQDFFVQLDNPVNSTIQIPKGTGLILNENGPYLPVDNTGYTSPLSYPGYTMTWSDEFDGNTIDLSSWSFESGNNNGWGNAELENYTDRRQNSFVSQGNLIIEARKEDLNGSHYTSARMISKNKRFFKFGRIDIRAKMPSGQGIWPALWMLGNNIDQVGWPACGEIDILELLGHQPNIIYGTLHWGESVSTLDSKGNSYVSGSGSFDQQFHVYSMQWKQDSISLLIDDIPYVSLLSTEVSGTYPFNNPFFFIFNIATGGSWPGSPDGTTVFPQRMVIDYVRVFQ